MPDISMCDGGRCPRRLECYRHRAIPTEYRQSYFAQPPFDEETGECGAFAKLWPGGRHRSVEDSNRAAGVTT